MLGPFLPEDNTIIESGTLIDGNANLSYDEFFFKMMNKVNTFFKVIKIILI